MVVASSDELKMDTPSNPDPSVQRPWLADRLYGAKPVAWRGRGELPQVPWSRSARGNWLVLDLWSGMGGLCLALLQCGFHFFAIAAEMDPIAANLCASNMPNVIHVPRVEAITAAALRPFLRRRRIRGILMGGGSPCQGNSSLNLGRRGIDDARSQQPLVMVQLRDDIRALPEAQSLELVSFLENVGSMPDSVEATYSDWMEGRPVLIDAAGCGWAHRRRLYWLVGSRGSVADLGQAPDSWEWLDDDAAVTLQYAGSKALPPRVHLDGGFQFMIDPQHVLEEKGKGAMHTFTREFRHPEDRMASVSAPAAERFLCDGKRFPPGAYGRLDDFHGLLGAGEITHQMQFMFPGCAVCVSVWKHTRERLEHCDLPALQAYYAWCQLRQLGPESLGPQPLLRADRAKLYSGLGGQRHPADSARGLDHLLPPGLGKSEHLRRALHLPSPFLVKSWPEADVSFVLDMICVWRECLLAPMPYP